jgi:potassium efflux system protein
LAQTEEPEVGVALSDISRIRGQVESDATLGSELKARILAEYDEARSALESTERFKAALGSDERKREAVNRWTDSLRTELSEPFPALANPLSQDATVEEAQMVLTEERSRLTALRNSLSSIEGLAEKQTTRRNEIALRFGALDQLIESTDERVRSETGGAHPELQSAVQAKLWAVRESAEAEIEALRSELTVLDAEARLVPWRRDRAQRQVEAREQLVTELEGVTEGLLDEEARERLSEIAEKSRAVSERLPELGAETENLVALAERVWGEEGVLAQLEEQGVVLTRTRKNIADLDRIVQLSRRRYEATGMSRSIVRWWPEIPEDFPKPGDLEKSIEQYELEISAAQHELIQLEQRRAGADESDRKMLAIVSASEEASELEEPVRELLQTHRELLELLIQNNGRYLNQLIELDSISKKFLAVQKDVGAFLLERLIWVRSVPGSPIPGLTDIWNAALWFLAPANLPDASGALWVALRAEPVRAVFWLLVIGSLIFFRPRIKRRVEALGELASQPETENFLPTLWTALYTVLLVAPAPLTVFIMGRTLAVGTETVQMHAASGALYWIAATLCLLEGFRQVCRPNGLGAKHFGWSEDFVHSLSRGLLAPQWIFVALTFVAITFATAGMRLQSSSQLQAHNNSLGRIAFVAAFGFFGIALIGLFRPRVHAGQLLKRLPMLTLPLIVCSTLAPAALAILGYYITGYLLAYQMLRTISLIVGVLVLWGLLSKWRVLSRRRATRKARESEVAAIESSGSKGLPPAGWNDRAVPVADKQVRQLNRFILIVIAAMGLSSIWTDAFPVLQGMKRVQIWPRVVYIEEDLDAPGPLSMQMAVADDAESRGGESASQEGEEDSKVSMPGQSMVESATDSEVSETGVLTLWHLFEAILAALVTVVLAKNIPGIVELVLIRRTHLDSGFRIAVSTLVRYIIVILGSATAFGYLNIGWSKVHWLAAALTFGLGFGLQEIVANFVSGLILLTERPIRVGDAVTIGNLMGRVTRIQIRATTITLWDRSEMIVPNKEFITTKLVNWTLSDSKRRLDIPLRVTYGSDVEQVKAILLKVADEHLLVLDDPPPNVLLTQFGENALEFELRVFVDFGHGIKTGDDIRVAVDKAFKENGIEFAIPALNISMERRKGARKDPGAKAPE